MSRPTWSRTTTIALPALACLTAVSVATPASAARPDGSSSVRSGQSASVSWTELDPADTLRLPGNTHVGQLFVESGFFGNFASGVISDFDCEPGQVPGGHGEPGTCTPMGERFLSAEGGTLTSGDRTATFTGQFTVSNGGHGGDGTVLGRPMASITWTSSTDLVRYRSTNTYTERGVSYRSTRTGLRSSEATTAVTGAIGAMGFADDADDVSVGQFESYTEVSRERLQAPKR